MTGDLDVRVRTGTCEPAPFSDAFGTAIGWEQGASRGPHVEEEEMG